MKNVKQETALHKAAASGCVGIVGLLLKLKSNEIRCNSSNCVHPEGYDIEGDLLNLDYLWKAQNVDGETALHYAARGDYVEIMRLLLEKVNGIELLENEAGESALYTACLHAGSVPLLKMLIESDSISDARTLDQQTCLHQLINSECTDEPVLYLLGKRPALAERLDDLGNAPLHLASIGGNLKIVEELLKECPEMALRKNKDEMAAIHHAARMGHMAVVRCLIENVPHCIEVLGKNNKNALHFALEYGQIGKARTLPLYSMDPSFLIDEADMHGQTAFHKAASNYVLVSHIKQSQK